MPADMRFVDPRKAAAGALRLDKYFGSSLHSDIGSSLHLRLLDRVRRIGVAAQKKGLHHMILH